MNGCLIQIISTGRIVWMIEVFIETGLRKFPKYWVCGAIPPTKVLEWPQLSFSPEIMNLNRVIVTKKLKYHFSW
jgi:hypothetical protein